MGTGISVSFVVQPDLLLFPDMVERAARRIYQENQSTHADLLPSVTNVNKSSLCPLSTFSSSYHQFLHATFHLLPSKSKQGIWMFLCTFPRASMTYLRLTTSPYTQSSFRRIRFATCLRIISKHSLRLGRKIVFGFHTLPDTTSRYCFIRFIQYVSPKRNAAIDLEVYRHHRQTHERRSGNSLRSCHFYQHHSSIQERISNTSIL